MAFRRGRRSGFRRHARVRQPVTASNCVMTRKSSCRGCALPLTPGETVVRLRLKKVYQVACTSCGHKPAKVKFFHTQCVPADLNQAMGVQPDAVPQAAAPRGGAVAPPPKPQTPQDAALAALMALEHALLVKAAQRGVTPEMEKKFATFQALKSQVLRPGSPGEEENATKLALKAIVNLVF